MNPGFEEIMSIRGRGMPEDGEGRKVSNSFLFNATLSMFEAQGFTRTRQLGKNSWLVTKKVRAARA